MKEQMLVDPEKYEALMAMQNQKPSAYRVENFI